MKKHIMRCHIDGGGGLRRDLSLPHARKLFSVVI
jgi:hypothetical protein